MPFAPDFQVRRPGRLAPAFGLLLALLAASVPARAAAPSTFGSVIGSAVLCLDHLDNAYFYSYLSASFGPPYKRQGGAYWFATDEATLWGEAVKEVIVSDDTHALTFIGAVVDATPEKLEQAIVTAAGLHYTRKDRSNFPVRESNPGSKIVYYGDQSKVFCAKYKPLPRDIP
jgi:hypothetical protein